MLTEAFLEILNQIKDKDISVILERVEFTTPDEEIPEDLMIKISIGTLSFDIKYNCLKTKSDDQFLLGFRKAAMMQTGHKLSRREFEKIVAEEIRKPGLELWLSMERKIRAQFQEFVSSGLTKAIEKFKYERLKIRVLTDLFGILDECNLTREQLLDLVGLVYDENLVREVIEL